MYDLCSHRLLESDESFAGRNGHRFVEIWNSDDGQYMRNTGELKEHEIAGWVDEQRPDHDSIQSGLRVLLSPKPSRYPTSSRLPFTRETYFALAKSWRIPSTFLRALRQKLSTVTQCSVAPVPSSETETTSFTDPQSFLETKERSPRYISDEARCLLVRGDVDWTWDYTMLSIYDPATRMTYVLISGLTATEIDFVNSYLSSPGMISTPILSTHPLLFPVMLLDLATDEMSALIKVRIKLLSQIQQRTGMDRFNFLKSAGIGGHKSNGGSNGWEKERARQELDLDAIMLRLTCLSDWVAAQKSFLGIQGRVARVVECMLQNKYGNKDDTAVRRMLGERLQFVQESLFAAEEKCQYLERSISAQVQTIYSLIGQKDNRLNIAAASASCQIASDSRNIAILTRRDSTDMRIIAAVTLLFLPGTFVATVFSTGLFDWEKDDSASTSGSGGDGGGAQKVLSKYIWVYFMLTGVLTAVVLMAWITFSWCQNRRMMRKFGKDVELGGGMQNPVENRRKTDETLVDGRQAGWKASMWGRYDRWKRGTDEVLKKWAPPRKGEHDGDSATRREELKTA